MKLCKVVGHANSSIKHSGLRGTKLLVIQDLEVEDRSRAELSLAVDTVGAGAGEVVAVVRGGSAVARLGLEAVACDAAVVAIIDHVYVDGKELYSKNEED